MNRMKTKERRAARAALILRDGNVCKACGVRGAFLPGVRGWHAERLQIDHVTPVAAGGRNALSNLQLLCHPCHAAKTAKERRSI